MAARIVQYPISSKLTTCFQIVAGRGDLERAHHLARGCGEKGAVDAMPRRHREQHEGKRSWSPVVSR